VTRRLPQLLELMEAYDASAESRLAAASRDNFLGAFATTENAETTASINNLLGGFGLIGHLKARVQRLNTEPANDQTHRTQIALAIQPTSLRRSGAVRLGGDRIRSSLNLNNKCTVHIQAIRKYSMSRIGGAPNIREYSRLT